MQCPLKIIGRVRLRARSGAGKWTVQQAAELSVAAPTIEAALDGRFLSGLKEERVEAAELFAGLGAKAPSVVSVRPASQSAAPDAQGFKGFRVLGRRPSASHMRRMP